MITSTLSRRTLLSLAASGSVAWGFRPALAGTADTEPDLRTAAVVDATLGVDTHNHIDVPLDPNEVPGPDIDLAGELRRAGLGAVCMTFAVDYQTLTEPGQAYARFKAGIASMDAQLRRNNMRRALNLADLQAARARREPTVIQSVEGGHFLEGRIERLQEAHAAGLRHFGLLHDNDATPPLGDVYTNPPQWGGLTPLGVQAIRECNRLGILIDMAHASEDTLLKALKLSSRPVVVSHTGLDTQLGDQPAMARMMRPRLISKQLARSVADAGGAIGVWTHLADSPAAFAANIRALVDVVGTDHVCIGTDTKLTPPTPRNPPAARDRDAPPPAYRAGRPGGSGGPGERRGERTNEIWSGQSAGFLYVVVDALLKAGFSPAEASAICGGNFCRLFDAATSRA